MQRPWGRTSPICEGWEKRAEWEPGWILQGLRAVGTLSVRPGGMQRCAHPVSHEGASGVGALPPSSPPCRHLPGARAGPRDPDLLTRPALGRAGALPAPGAHPAALRPHPGRQGAELRAGGGPAPGGSRSMPLLVFLSSPCPHPSPCSLQGAPVSTGQGRPQFLAHPAELEIAAWVAQRFLICSAGLTGLFTQAPEPQVAIKLGGPRKQTWLIRPMSPRSGVFSWSFLGFRYLGEGVEGGVFCMPILPLQISPRGNLKKK